MDRLELWGEVLRAQGAALGEAAVRRALHAQLYTLAGRVDAAATLIRVLGVGACTPAQARRFVSYVEHLWFPEAATLPRIPEIRCVAGALLRDGHVLMVEHTRPDRHFWSLPGGHVEPRETPAGAVVREVWEEVRLRAAVVRPLYYRPTGAGDWEEGFLLEADGAQVPQVGEDPERGPGEQVLTAVAWKQLEDVAEDRQVCCVLRALQGG